MKLCIDRCSLRIEGVEFDLSRCGQLSLCHQLSNRRIPVQQAGIFPTAQAVRRRHSTLKSTQSAKRWSLSKHSVPSSAMFKKKPLVKNLSPLRSSDRRRLADQIISDYRVLIPTDSPSSPPEDEQSHDVAHPEAGDASKLEPGASSSNVVPSLAGIRNQLLPDSTSSARFTTTTGPDSTPVSGTVYVGAHPNAEARVLWVQYGKNPALIPTVYTLWHNPGLVPLLHTPDFVVEQKLRQGADLMIPGLFKASGTVWDPRAVKGSVVAVGGITRDTVPVWVGTCDVDVSQLGDDFRGQKGVAAKGLHWEGDEIWNWSAVAGAGGRASPATLEGWTGLSSDVEHAMGNMSLDVTDEKDEEAGGAPVKDYTSQAYAGQADLGEQLEAGHQDEQQIPTTAEVDKAFHQAFLFSLFRAKQTNKGPNYGFDFPIQPSFLIANMVQPNLYHQSPHYNIKKTSWKNAKKYIKHLDKSGLAKSKDRNGGETVILAIDFENPQINTFVPYKLPSSKVVSGQPATSEPSADSPSPNDSAKGQKLIIRTYYRAAPKLVPDLLASKTEFYTAQQVTSALKAYVDQRPELGAQSSSSLKLDAFIANNILGSSPTHAQEDNRVIALGRISRGALQKRILDDARLCQPYYIIDRNTGEASDQKPKPGQPPHVNIVVEKRTGTKVVTRLSNLEPFFINPHQLAPELQKKCAGSCSVTQLQGGKVGMLEVVIQGDQTKILTTDVLPKRGVDAKWIDVLDKTKPKKK